MITSWMLLPSIADGLSPADSLSTLATFGAVVMTSALWRVFRLAGELGWAAFVPVYNGVVLLRIAGMSAWWVVLLLAPIVNLCVLLAVAIGVARRFGHGGGFAAGLWLVPFVFYPILALDDERPLTRAA